MAARCVGLAPGAGRAFHCVLCHGSQGADSGRGYARWRSRVRSSPASSLQPEITSERLLTKSPGQWILSPHFPRACLVQLGDPLADPRVGRHTTTHKVAAVDRTAATFLPATSLWCHRPPRGWIHGAMTVRCIRRRNEAKRLLRRLTGYRSIFSLSQTRRVEACSAPIYCAASNETEMRRELDRNFTQNQK